MLTRKEQQERERLHRKWATQRATLTEMRRAMALDRKAERDRAEYAQAAEMASAGLY